MEDAEWGAGSGRQELDASSLSCPPAPLPGHCLPLVSLGGMPGRPRDLEGRAGPDRLPMEGGTPRRSHLLGEAGQLQPLQASGATVSLEGNGWASAPRALPCAGLGAAGQPHPLRLWWGVWPCPAGLAARWQRQRLSTQPYKQIYNYGKGTVKGRVGQRGGWWGGGREAVHTPLLLRPLRASCLPSENLKTLRGSNLLSSSSMGLFVFNAQGLCTCWMASQGPSSSRCLPPSLPLRLCHMSPPQRGLCFFLVDEGGTEGERDSQASSLLRAVLLSGLDRTTLRS